MDCPDCGSPTVAFDAGEYADALPGGGRSGSETDGAGTGVALCTRCLALHPAADPPANQPDFQRVSDAFPANPDAAVPLALLVGLLENLALYRAEIADLLGAVERAGTDPMLVLDRLAADESIETDVDLAGRRKQLEQLL
ncbi:MAG: DUF6276 family protein [Haloarculaceae archaeon]